MSRSLTDFTLDPVGWRPYVQPVSLDAATDAQKQQVAEFMQGFAQTQRDPQFFGFTGPGIPVDPAVTRNFTEAPQD